MGNTALSFPDDAGMIRVDEHSGLGFAIATDCNGRFCQLDPYEGAKLALAEAYRNVAVTGAVPDRRHRLPQLRQPREPRGHVAVLAGRRGPRRTDASSSASRSPAATSRSTTRPATSRSSRRPSSACSASSTTSRAASRRGWQDPGENIYLLGVTATELSGSAWAGTVHGHLGGRPPAVDLGTREAARRAAARGIPAVARLERARPVVRRSRAGARRGASCASASARASGSRAHGARRGGCRIRPLLGVHRPRHRDRAARGRREVPRAVRGPGLPGAAHRRDRRPAGRRRRTPALEVQGLFTVPLAELRDLSTSTLPGRLRRDRVRARRDVTPPL